MIQLDSIECDLHIQTPLICGIQLSNKLKRFSTVHREQISFDLEDPSHPVQITFSTLLQPSKNLPTEIFEILNCDQIPPGELQILASGFFHAPKNLESGVEIKMKKRLVLDLEVGSQGTDSGSSYPQTLIANFEIIWINVKNKLNNRILSKGLIDLLNNSTDKNLSDDLTRDTSPKKNATSYSPSRSNPYSPSKSTPTQSPQPKSFDRSCNEKFLLQRVDPLFEKLLIDILLDKPRSISAYTSRWMDRWGAYIENGL
jgi:hypothetical protein